MVAIDSREVRIRTHYLLITSPVSNHSAIEPHNALETIYILLQNYCCVVSWSILWPIIRHMTGWSTKWKQGMQQVVDYMILWCVANNNSVISSSELRDGKDPEPSENETNQNPGFAKNWSEPQSKNAQEPKPRFWVLFHLCQKWCCEIGCNQFMWPAILTNTAFSMLVIITSQKCITVGQEVAYCLIPHISLGPKGPQEI